MLRIGETTILVPQVYHVCTIGPLNLKRVQLVPQVLKLSWIDHFTNSVNDIAYVANGIMSRHIFEWSGMFLIKKLKTKLTRS